MHRQRAYKAHPGYGHPKPVCLFLFLCPWLPGRRQPHPIPPVYILIPLAIPPMTRAGSAKSLECPDLGVGVEVGNRP